MPSPPTGAWDLQYAPASAPCRLVAAEPITFRLQPEAPAPVVAVTDRGEALEVLWSPGFVADTLSGDPVVRDPSGRVVARDGDRVTVAQMGAPEILGFRACFGRGVYALLPTP
jgi:hypothetical protein